MRIVKHITAGCFLIRKNNLNVWEIILIHREWSKDNQGWVPPKGHIEKGETLEETAIRETIEETGYYNIKIVEPLEELHIEYTSGDAIKHKKSISYFLARLASNVRKSLDLNQYERDTTLKNEWIPLKDAEKYLQFDNEREILKKVIMIVKGKGNDVYKGSR